MRALPDALRLAVFAGAVLMGACGTRLPPVATIARPAEAVPLPVQDRNRIRSARFSRHQALISLTAIEPVAPSLRGTSGSRALLASHSNWSLITLPPSGKMSTL
jgi:hypothetical protein